MKRIGACVLGLFLLLAGSALGQTIGTSGTLTNTNDTVTLSSYGTMGVSITGAFVMTINFEGTVDGTNWFPMMTQNCTTGSAGTTTAATGLYQIPANGMRQARVRANPVTSGTATIFAYTMLYASKPATSTYAGSPPGVIYVGGDPTGVADSTAAICSGAIDTVLNNPTLFNTVSFKAGGRYKMNNQCLRTGIPTTTTLIIQGNGATIDATGSVDATVFDLEGSQSNNAMVLNAPITKGDTQFITNTNPDNIVANGYVLISTRNTGIAHTATGVVGSGVNCNVTSVNPTTAFANADGINVSNNSGLPIPFGSTVSAGGGTATLTLNTNGQACTSTGTVSIFNPNQNWIFANTLAQSYRGELVQVDSVSGSGPFTFVTKTHIQDSYGTAFANAFSLNAPKIQISNLTLLRSTASNFTGMVINYAHNIDFGYMTIQGATDYGVRTGWIHTGRIHDGVHLNGYSTTGNSKAIADLSSHWLRIDHNTIYQHRGGVDTGGQEPVRFCFIDHNTIANQETSTLTLGAVNIHENADRIFIDDNSIFNGGITAAVSGGVSGGGLWMRRNAITGNLTSSGSGIYAQMQGNADNIFIDGNVIDVTNNWTAQCIAVSQFWGNVTLKRLTITGNTCTADPSGTKTAQVIIQPNNAGYTGNVINLLTLGRNFVQDNSTSPLFILGPQGTTTTQVLEAFVDGDRYEALSASAADGIFRYDPAAGSGPITFRNTVMKTGRSPNGGTLISIGATNGSTHTVTDVTMQGGLFNACTVGGACTSGRLAFTFNTGRVALMDLDLVGMQSRSGLFPDNGGAACNGSPCVAGTSSPLNYYLRNAAKTNVGGTLTFPAGTGFVDDRGMAQTQIAATDWVASANWGTTPTKTPNGYDGSGNISILAQATTGAAPTLTLTYKQPFLVAPGTAGGPTLSCALLSNTVYTAPSAVAPIVGCTSTTTALTITANFTPTAGNTYTFGYTIK